MAMEYGAVSRPGSPTKEPQRGGPGSVPELLAAGAPGRDAQCGLRRPECAVSPCPRNGASVSPAPGRPCPGASLALAGSTPAPEQRAQSPRTLGVHLRLSGSQARPRPPPAPSGCSLEPSGRRPQLCSRHCWSRAAFFPGSGAIRLYLELTP